MEQRPETGNFLSLYGTNEVFDEKPGNSAFANMYGADQVFDVLRSNHESFFVKSVWSRLGFRPGTGEFVF